MTIMTMKSSSILFAALAAASATTSSVVMAQQSDKSRLIPSRGFADPALTDKRIVGGKQSEIGDYPYFGKYNTIILKYNTRFIMSTAANNIHTIFLVKISYRIQ